MYDVIVIGAGPAGLSAALLLGRCRRQVLVCDSGQPRNGASPALHGFVSRDGVAPLELRRLGRAELDRYPDVEYVDAEATDVVRDDGGFGVTLGDGRVLRCRMLLLATGLVDRLPAAPGFRELYGRSVFHCPYCDGWEVRDRPLAAYGPPSEGPGLALTLLRWSPDVVLLTDGASLGPAERVRLERHGVGLREERLVRLEEASEGGLTAVFEAGERLRRGALFFYPEQVQRSPLVERLGCRVTPGGVAEAGKFQSTEVPGLFLAGDAARSVQFAIVAAAEGAEAAYAINTALQKADLG